MAGSPCSLCRSFGKGVGGKGQEHRHERGFFWVIAVISGHGGIGGEDRALSCLPVHVLCFHNCPQFVVAFISWRVLPVSQLASLTNLVVGVRKLGVMGD
jgi:hypothetical protein